MNMIFIMSKTNQINIFSGTHYNTYVINEKNYSGLLPL